MGNHASINGNNVTLIQILQDKLYRSFRSEKQSDESFNEGCKAILFCGAIAAAQSIVTGNYLLKIENTYPNKGLILTVFNSLVLLLIGIFFIYGCMLIFISSLTSLAESKMKKQIQKKQDREEINQILKEALENKANVEGHKNILKQKGNIRNHAKIKGNGNDVRQG